VLEVNGLLYLWRTAFVRANDEAPPVHERCVAYEVPRLRGLDVDTRDELELAEAILASGLVHLPWL
jgi:CMP-N-acetylneuraminic acid synthetase